ncbi:MAG: ABC transporter ATP-binding protein [Acidobacteria bacterium]|nr:ABC transporter ATP-binding protein [Acidobacteriota bacterium]
MSSPTNPSSVLLAGVRFGYNSKLPDVIDLDRFELSAGESCFLYGPSGCGKTTLLGLIAGVLEARQGSVNVLGKDLRAMSSSKRDAFRGSNIGYIFQMFNLIPYLSVRDNILLPTRLHSARKAEGLEAIASTLGIAPLLDRGVLELSVGQQQRVAAARALIGAPPLVIADEPTSALDSAHRQRFLELLLAQCKSAGAALLFVSHDQSLAPLFEKRLSLPDLNRASRTEVA